MVRPAETVVAGQALSPANAPSPMPTSRAALLRAALRYAAAGIAVMPLHTPHQTEGCSCRDGAECGSPGKHPRLEHGVRDATTNPGLLRAWWRRWPDANVGLATGTVLDVCDIDTNDGLRAVLDLLDVVRPAGPLVRTGLGWHLWFTASALPCRVGMLPGVDWRGHGGGVVAPPSLHVIGRRYTFQQPRTSAPLPECPPPLRRLVLPPTPAPTAIAVDTITDPDRYTRAALDGELARIRAAPRPVIRHGQRIIAGGRNNALHLAAFRLGQLADRGGLDEATIWARLTDAALDVGLTPAETRRTIASGWRAGRRRPRR
ncbi:bifunctional DNA primase/polymerase [Dactylosporangium sp. CA-139114]|uniref:bifunctional DNA primase/polymerase n=1 Tax=Dactylosporangium sp. CA-139114 TaxID=3239931 RepID=UPI003D99A995